MREERSSLCQLHFLDWEDAILPAAARLLADLHLADRRIELGAWVLAVPGERAGRRLMELLLEEAEMRGRGLDPPRVTTAGSLSRILHDPSLPLADRILEQWSWADVLRSAPREVLDAVLPGERPSDVPGWFDLAGVFAELHREVGGEGIAFGEVAERVRADFPDADEGRWRALADLQRTFLARLREMGFADPQESRRSALMAGDVHLSSPLWLIGIVELPSLIRRALVQAAENGTELRAIVHAPECRREDFDGFGCVRTEAWAEATVPISDASIRITGGPAAQADEVLRFLGGLDEVVRADDLVLGVPDPEVVPLVEERLAGFGVPSRHAAGHPLDRSGPFRLLSAVADHIDAGDFSSFAALVRHPEMEEPIGRDARDLLRAADRYASQHLPGDLAAGLAGDDPLRKKVDAARGRLDAPELLGRFRGVRSIGEWIPEILGFLTRVYGKTPLDRNHPRERMLLDVFEKLAEIGSSLHDLPVDDGSRIPAAGAIRILLSMAHESSSPYPAEQEAVELLGWLELHLDDAPCLAVTGMNEGFVPETRSGDPFLPDALRSKLGLPNAARRGARDRYLLHAILSSRDQVRLIAGRRDGEGNPLRPSRLLLMAEGVDLARRVRVAFGEGESEGAAAAIPSRLEPGVRSGFVLPPEPEIELSSELHRRPIPVTAFRTLLADPYRFALSRVRRLVAVDDEGREMDAALFGHVAHRVLERFGREVEAPEDPEAAGRTIEDLLWTEAKHRFGARPLPAVRLQLEHLRVRLDAFAKRNAEWVQDGWRMGPVEQQPDEPGVPFDVDGVTVRLTGRIDRIDHHPRDGLWAVLDYKTGETGAHPEKTHRRRRAGDLEWLDLQLPLYLELLKGMKAADGTPLVPTSDPDRVKLGYVNLPRRIEDTGFLFADWGRVDLASAEEAARQAVRALLSEPARFDAERWRSWWDDPLDPVVGLGRMAGATPGSPDEEASGAA